MDYTKIKPTYLLGYPLGHSKSKLFQNAAFAHYKINSIYLNMQISPDYFDTVIKNLQQNEIYALNVTLPYKIRIIPFLDELSDDAKEINSVNTIEVIDNKWKGHNTDWYGVFKTLENSSIDRNVGVLIIGAGGATNGLVYGLQKYGIKNITITNRTMEKAQIIANNFNINIMDHKNIVKKHEKYNLIINSTSVDFNLLLNNFPDHITFFDLKYYSQKPQCKHFINGYDMLLYQGAKAFTIWTGYDAPINIMKEALIVSQ